MGNVAFNCDMILIRRYILMLKLLKISGRARRSQFWQLVLIGAALAALASYLDEAYIAEWRGFLPGETDAGSPLFFTVLAVFAWPVIAIAARRLHDHNMSGWWLLLGFVGLGAIFLMNLVKGTELLPLISWYSAVGLIPLMYWFLKRGPNDTNRFG